MINERLTTEGHGRPSKAGSPSGSPIRWEAVKTGLASGDDTTGFVGTTDRLYKAEVLAQIRPAEDAGVGRTLSALSRASVGGVVKWNTSSPALLLLGSAPDIVCQLWYQVHGSQY